MLMEMNGENGIVELNEEELEEVVGAQRVEITGRNVCIYSDHDVHSAIQAHMNRGMHFTYAGRTWIDADGTKWYMVERINRYGWICGKYARLLKN